MIANRIDSHQNFWRYDSARDTWLAPQMAALRRDYLPDHLAPLLKENGFDGSVVVQAEQADEATDFLLQLAAEHAFVRGVVGWVDLERVNLAERLETLRAYPKLRGFRHRAHVEANDRFLVKPEVVRGIRLLTTLDLTFDMLVSPKQLPAAIQLARLLPDQLFVLDHMAKPTVKEGTLQPWAAQLRELARSPNVWCKISGIVTEASWDSWHPNQFRPYLDVAFQAFGPERVMFGSDWPTCTLAAEYESVVGLIESYARQFSAEDRDLLFGGNAARFYGLPH